MFATLSDMFGGGEDLPRWSRTVAADDGRRFIVTADEKLTAFLELERVTRESLRFPNVE
jgi:hypothetical protein